MNLRLTRYPDDTTAHPVLTPRANIAWESKGVFNPGVIYDNGMYKMLYRTFTSDTELDEHSLHHQMSMIGYAESTDGIHFTQRDTPCIAPDQSYDKGGCEDPRITKIGDTFYITYTAIDAQLGGPDKVHVRIALATTKDFVSVEKHGIIGPEKTSKACALFPETAQGDKIAMALTIGSDSENSHVAIRYFDSLDAVTNPQPGAWEEFLKDSEETAVLQTAQTFHRGPELGAPPIKTERGWLLIFSPESMSDTWTIGAALLDLDKPHTLIARTPGYLLQPRKDYEMQGMVANVTFPSAAVVVSEELYVYYGCADKVIGLATCKLSELLDYIEKYKER